MGSGSKLYTRKTEAHASKKYTPRYITHAHTGHHIISNFVPIPFRSLEPSLLFFSGLRGSECKERRENGLVVPLTHGALEEGVVAGELVEGTVEANLLGGGGDLEVLAAGLAGGAVGADVERAGGAVDAAVAGAGGDAVLEARLVGPALEIVAVEATGRENKVSPRSDSHRAHEG